ncbi:PepSY-associated TM helix domain-containing protein [Bradyrhizobium sp. STM 3557]|uniref:PepSY-associated TM helix domain-containing protein n=1 Tax=Bradyrhizobium sp. STM 3557 TaxID=578920 RepID=UPI00388E05CB
MPLPFMFKPAIKAALLQIHSIIGLVIALLLTVVALTGVTMSFEEEIQAGLNAGMSHVEARQAPLLTPDELIARLPPSDGRVAAIMLSSDPTSAVRIRFAPSHGGSRPTSVFVDPYDAHVLGTPRGEEFFATVRRLHRWLLIPGDAKGYGRQITGIATISLLVLLISGLVLRWPHRAASAKMWLKPNFGLRGRGLHRSLHAVIGTWVLPIYLVMTLTGLWYSFDWYKNGAVWLLSRPRAADAELEPKAPRGARAAKSDVQAGTKRESRPLALDRVWATFQQLERNRFRTVLMNLPAGDATIVRVRAWAEDSTEGPRDEFRIDAASGELVSSELYADKTIGERMLMRVLDIHRGSIFGWPGKLVFMLAAAAMPLFAVTGLLLYVSRRRHRRLAHQAEMRLVPGE